MSFSGGLKLTDLDDHITPSVACILPVESKFEKKDPEKKGGHAKTIIQLEDGDAFEVIDGESQKLEKATIDLNDCLACSGCITTAESILVSLQSHLELYKALENKLDPNNPIQHIVVSIAPQVFANLAAKFNVPSQKIVSNLVRFLHLLGVDQVIDVTIGRDLSLVYSAQEFVQNYRHRQNPTNAVNITPLNTPILSSLCPGWICYAEKTHGFILPHISKVKSPQQIVGSLVKYWYGPKINLRPDQIYHVSVMPCYDKKLEASRQDFYNDIFSTRDVDCVLTTTEMEKLMEEKGYSWDESVEDVMDSPLHKLSNIPPNIAQEWQYYPSSPHLYSLSSSTTGGYVNYIMQYAAKELFNIDLSVEHSHNVSIKTIRNSDYQEISLINGDTTLLKFALAYGFRNIQNIIRKAKTNKVSQYDYVEIMACPSGCINGGGQSKHQTLHGKEWTAQMLTKYSEMNPFPQLPHLNPLLLALDQDWQPTHGEVNHIVTDYKAVENTITATTGLGTKW